MEFSPPRITNFLAPMLYRTQNVLQPFLHQFDIPRKPVIFSNSITTPNARDIVVSVLTPTKKAVTLKKDKKLENYKVKLMNLGRELNQNIQTLSQKALREEVDLTETDLSETEKTYFFQI